MLISILPFTIILGIFSSLTFFLIIRFNIGRKRKTKRIFWLADGILVFWFSTVFLGGMLAMLLEPEVPMRKNLLFLALTLGYMAIIYFVMNTLLRGWLEKQATKQFELSERMVKSDFYTRNLVYRLLIKLTGDDD